MDDTTITGAITKTIRIAVHNADAQQYIFDRHPDQALAAITALIAAAQDAKAELEAWATYTP